MEILSFLRLTGRRVAGLSVVAGLAGAGAGYAATLSPATYEATATVFVGQALPAGYSSFDLPALVADFQAALGLAPVIDATAEAAELTPEDFTVTASRNGDGSTVLITVSGPTAAAAEAVASSISLEAMSFVTTRQVDRARSLEAQRSDEARLARSALSELDSNNGFIDPIAQYAAVQSQATQLQLEAENPGSNLADGARAGQLEQARSLRDSLPQLALKAQQYQTASKTLFDAEASVSNATRERVAAEAVQASATSSDAVAGDKATAVSPLTAVMRAAGAAVLVTGAAGVGTLALLDGRRRRRAERAASSAPAEETTAAAGNAEGPSFEGPSSDGPSCDGAVPAGTNLSEAPGKPVSRLEEAAEVFDHKAHGDRGAADLKAGSGRRAGTGRAALTAASNGRDGT